MGSIRRSRWCGLVLVLCRGAGVALAEGPKTITVFGKNSGKENPPKNPWPKLTDAQQANAIAELKKFADQAGDKFVHPPQLIETTYFLFVSDLPPAETRKWAALLDKMYLRLAEIFAVPNGENIWRGKAIVFVFANSSNYAHFERTMFGNNPGSAVGLCHEKSDGQVVISFFRSDDEQEFSHVLVHESVHGFIHRFRTPVAVPSWVNEGLAESIAAELVPQPGRRERVKSLAHQGVQEHGNVGDMFHVARIAGWQYPVAETLCTMMMQQNQRGYVEFMLGLKDGIDSVECLETKYQVSQRNLTAKLKDYLGL